MTKCGSLLRAPQRFESVHDTKYFILLIKNDIDFLKLAAND